MSKPTKQELIDHVESLVAKCAELTSERNEARRCCARWHAGSTVYPPCSPQQYAVRMGWDCFKENTDG